MRDDGRVLPIEVKVANTVGAHATQHLRWLAGRIGTSLAEAVIINTGPTPAGAPTASASFPSGRDGTASFVPRECVE